MAKAHFQPHELKAMGEAYDAAVHALGNPGREIPRPVREALARRIFEVASEGVLDRDRLTRAGLAAVAPEWQEV